MPFVPAVCDTCYTVFSSELYVKNTQLNLSGVRSGMCPNCQTTGHVISGIYKFVDYMIGILQDEGRTVLELHALHDVLMIADEYDVSQKQLVGEIRERLPEFNDLLLLLPDTKADYKLCLSLIIQALTAIIDISIQESKHYSTEGVIKIDQHIKVNQVIDQIYTNNTGTARRLF